MISLFFALVLMAPTKKILILGDSISDGYGVEAQASYPELVERKLRNEKINADVLNGSISGSLSSSAVGRLKWQLRAKPDILILQLGGNDALKGTPPSVIKENLRLAISLAKENNVKVLLAGMRIFDNYGEKYSREFEQLFQDLAREERVPLIPFILENVGGKKQMNLADGIHPNERGHEVIAETVLKYLRPLL